MPSMTFSIGTPHRHNAGYFVNDKDLRTRQEAHVQTCSHCQAIIKMEDWKLSGGWCSKCAKPLCSQPSCQARTALMGCVPFTQQIDQAITAANRLDRLLRSYPDVPLLTLG
jgi:hypothetical protein